MLSRANLYLGGGLAAVAGATIYMNRERLFTNNTSSVPSAVSQGQAQRVDPKITEASAKLRASQLNAPKQDDEGPVSFQVDHSNTIKVELTHEKTHPPSSPRADVKKKMSPRPTLDAGKHIEEDMPAPSDKEPWLSMWEQTVECPWDSWAQVGEPAISTHWRYLDKALKKLRHPPSQTQKEHSTLFLFRNPFDYALGF